MKIIKCPTLCSKCLKFASNRDSLSDTQTLIISEIINVCSQGN
jgi:hypothetical protein